MQGDLVRKKFSITMSKKFPDDTLVVETFSTEIERSCNTEEEILALADQVCQSTMDDLANRSKKSSLTLILKNTVAMQVTKEQKRNAAEAAVKATK